MKNKCLIMIGLLVFILFLDILGVIDLAAIEDNHFDIITVNSIFAGFLFSALSLIFGLGKDNSIILLERMEAMDKIYSSIIMGISCSLFSIACSLTNILTNNMYGKHINQIEIYFLVLAILYFIISVKHITLIIKMLRKEMKKDLPNKEALKHALDKIK